jgi:hypothetical protein
MGLNLLTAGLLLEQLVKAAAVLANLLNRVNQGEEVSDEEIEIATAKGDKAVADWQEMRAKMKPE